MVKRYIVQLDPEQRRHLQTLVNVVGVSANSKIVHANILLRADQSHAGPAENDRQVAQKVHVSPRTVARVRQRYAEHGLEAALERRRRATQQPRKICGRARDVLLELYQTKPPDGRPEWTLRSLAKQLVQERVVESISHESVRKALREAGADDSTRSERVGP